MDRLHSLSTKVSKMSRTIDKPYDTTKFTDQQIKLIRAEYEAKEQYNSRIRAKIIPGSLVTNHELVSMLNSRFSMSKSIRTYARVWNSTGSN